MITYGLDSINVIWGGGLKMKKGRISVLFLLVALSLLLMFVSSAITLDVKGLEKTDSQILQNKQARNVSTEDTSIAATIATADKTKVILVPGPSGETYKEYNSNEAGVKQALFDLYQQPTKQDYVLYFGSNLTLSASTMAKTIPATPDASSMTFYALKDKIGRLTLTAHPDDPISSSTSLVANTKILNLPTNTYFGSNINLRNIDYRGTTLYLNGYDFTTNGGAVGNGFTVFGGTDSGNLTGNPTITINTTGSGTWTLYGGNNNGGTLTGNTTIVVNQTSGNISGIYGGARVGTIDGNVTTKIIDINGTLNTYYGGGYGESASNSANVTGTVTSSINIANAATNFRLGSYVGGVNYGTIQHTIMNTISGYGRWTGNGQRFTGGSNYGDIGQSGNQDAIITNFDTSQYKSGQAEFEGGNRNQGTIYGNITNQVLAGTYLSGSLGDINGGGGNDIAVLSQSSMGANNETTYDASTPEQRAEIAKKAANFKVFGNISTKLLGGSVSNNAIRGDSYYTTAAGRGGYVEGDTTIEVGVLNEDGKPGGAGMVYRGSYPTYSLEYSTSNKTRGYNTNWDIVGGGGDPVRNGRWDMYIKGNTKLVINNAVARWTYGGSFTGVIEGNSSHTLNSGLIDTMEGTGYNGARVYGNGSSVVNNGQVDWFLTGGGWDDSKIVGNAKVVVNDGTINASMGATYGVAGSHTVTGNGEMYVYGGDFSGTPRTGNNGFSGGVTNSGYLLGNTSLTIDLRKSDKEFKLPTGTYITGGRPYGVNTNLGTNEQNTITMNIFTKPGVDSLNGATIYGDGGGTSGNNTKSGSIKMNIQAAGSNIGTLYATQYSNIVNGKILRNVEANIQGANQINGLSGGNADDNFTNTIVANSTNQVRYNFGNNIDGTDQYQTDPINITGKGIINFNELNVTNGLKIFANGGNILNGGGATAANHSTTYNNFGSITLSKNSGLEIANASNYLSGSKLTVQDEGTIESPQGTGKINLADFETPNIETDRLTWIKNTTNTTALLDITGTYFGKLKGYQVLTINPVKTNATKIGPRNFKGIEKATGKTYVGDNDITGSTNGYGVAIPGSIIDYEVEQPGIVEGTGNIFHDVTQVKANNEPLTLQAWGTEIAATRVQKGRLIIPYSTSIIPTLTFEPETKTTGSWLYQGAITTTKVNEGPTTVAEQADSSSVDWKSPSGEYSYQVKIVYSNKVELTSRNVIMTQDQAQKLTNIDEVVSLMNAKGRPFFTSSLTQEQFEEIKATTFTENESSKKYPITYKAGTTSENQQSQTRNLVVVSNNAVISDDQQFAVYAQDIQLPKMQANALNDQSDLDQFTKATVIFADNTENTSAQLPKDTFTMIQQTTADQLPNEVKATYSYTLGEKTLFKDINVYVYGVLELLETPASIDFGTQKITTKTMTYWSNLSDNLLVRDTRGKQHSPWQLMVTQMRPLTNKSNSNDYLESVLFYQDQENIIELNEGAVPIYTTDTPEDKTYEINTDWSKENKKGIQLTVPVEQQKKGAYEGTLVWSLVDAPGNE